MSQLLVILDEGTTADSADRRQAAPAGVSPAVLPRTWTPLRLAYGRADLDAPRYDLALLAPQLLGGGDGGVAGAEDARAPDVVR
jgi:hypothetical protein